MTEGRNADLMAQQFEEDETVKIPSIYWDYTTKQVLTMEFIEGIKLDQLDELKEKGFDLKWLADRVVHTLFYQVFKDGYFHADPHIGNIFAESEKRIAWMDFGLMGRLSSKMRMHLASLVMAMVKQDSDDMIKAIFKMGVAPEDVDIHELSGDIDRFMIKYYGVPLSELSLGQSITDLFSIANKHQIMIPSDLSLVGKTILTLEGLIEQLDPEFDIIEAAEPFGRDLIREKYNPKRLAKSLYDQIDEYGDVIEDMPEVIRELSHIAKNKKIPIEISIPKAEHFSQNSIQLVIDYRLVLCFYLLV
ncbi:ABC1 kinase family protein [Piscibacillus salipiscarius]|uniref:ABC1 kinase family protein n=1 Tax=Piscibacillus salipiscarius TaxID=299480 RepID=UPI0034E1D9B9